MSTVVERLIDHALSEVVRRDPGFLEREAVAAPDPAAMAGASAGLDAAEVERRLTAGFRRLAEGGLRQAPGGEDHSLLGEVLAAGVLDAFAAEEGRLDLRPAPSPTLDEALGGFDRRTAAGVDYLVRRGGERPLVLINALGIPLDVWARLLGDTDHDFRVLVVESAGVDLIRGGMRADSSLADDVERISRALDAEGIDRAGVVGWCSGGRLAVELAAREPERVGSLTLVSASFRGAMPDEPRPTQFESDVAAIFASVERSPASADFLSRMLMQAQGAAGVAADDAALFRLPAQAHAGALSAPLATGEQLRLYAARIGSDKQHRTAEALERVRAPILAVTGAHDHILDNAVTLATLKAHAPRWSAVSVSGAGHYVHDLQYPYLRLMLERALEGAQPPESARIRSIG